MKPKTTTRWQVIKANGIPELEAGEWPTKTLALKAAYNWNAMKGLEYEDRMSVKSINR